MRNQMARHLAEFSIARAQRVAPGEVVSVAPPAPPTSELDTHDYKIFLLSTAAEIEHALMVQYLFATYSLIGPYPSPSPPKNAAPELNDVLEWQRIILGVAKEEMGHLITVQNILKLLGGPLHLERDDYPIKSEFFPFEFHLSPLSLDVLAKYVVAESPMDWPSSVSPAEKAEIIQRAQGGAGGEAVKRVGLLYEELIELLGDHDKLPDELFRAETFPFQAEFDEYGRGYAAKARGDSPLTAPDVLIGQAATRTQAIDALKQIAQQGEAGETIDADKEDSHFTRFLTIYRRFKTKMNWSPVLPLATDPVVDPSGTSSDGSPIKNALAAAWGALFNVRYRMLLAYLAHSFRHHSIAATKDSPGRRGQLITRMFGEMYVLKSVSGLITQLPLDADLAVRAGPPFQMPYTLNYPERELDFWRMHLDLLDSSRKILKDLAWRFHVVV